MEILENSRNIFINVDHTFKNSIKCYINVVEAIEKINIYTSINKYNNEKQILIKKFFVSKKEKNILLYYLSYTKNNEIKTIVVLPEYYYKEKQCVLPIGSNLSINIFKLILPFINYNQKYIYIQNFPYNERLIFIKNVGYSFDKKRCFIGRFIQKSLNNLSVFSPISNSCDKPLLVSLSPISQINIIMQNISIAEKNIFLLRSLFRSVNEFNTNMGIVLNNIRTIKINVDCSNFRNIHLSTKEKKSIRKIIFQHFTPQYNVKEMLINIKRELSINEIKVYNAYLLFNSKNIFVPNIVYNNEIICSFMQETEHKINTKVPMDIAISENNRSYLLSLFSNSNIGVINIYKEGLLIKKIDKNMIRSEGELEKEINDLPVSKVSIEIFTNKGEIISENKSKLLFSGVCIGYKT